MSHIIIFFKVDHCCAQLLLSSPPSSSGLEIRITKLGDKCELFYDLSDLKLFNPLLKMPENERENLEAAAGGGSSGETVLSKKLKKTLQLKLDNDTETVDALKELSTFFQVKKLALIHIVQNYKTKKIIIKNAILLVKANCTRLNNSIYSYCI